MALKSKVSGPWKYTVDFHGPDTLLYNTVFCWKHAVISGIYMVISEKIYGHIRKINDHFRKIYGHHRYIYGQGRKIYGPIRCVPVIILTENIGSYVWSERIFSSKRPDIFKFSRPYIWADRMFLVKRPYILLVIRLYLWVHWFSGIEWTSSFLWNLSGMYEGIFGSWISSRFEFRIRPKARNSKSCESVAATVVFFAWALK